MRIFINAAVIGVSLLLSGTASADEASIIAVPTAWRMEDYMNGGVDVWYSGAACPTGHLILSPNAPSDTKNRFWSLIMTAKVARVPVGVYYDTATCVVTHFFMVEQ